MLSEILGKPKTPGRLTEKENKLETGLKTDHKAAKMHGRSGAVEQPRLETHTNSRAWH